MRLLILATLFLLTACQSPQTLEKLTRPNARDVADSGGFLYEISKGASRFHLFGTVHLAPSGKNLPLKRSVLLRLAQADQVFLEMILPEYVDEPVQEKQEDLLTQFSRDGSAFAAKPSRYCKFTTAGPDYWIARLSIREGILLRGLETLEERAALFKAIPSTELAGSAFYKGLQKISEKNTPSPEEEQSSCRELHALWQDWRAEKPSQFEQRAEQYLDDPMMKVMILERNTLFYLRMQEALQNSRNTLFVVGAGHLYGQSGLLKRFRADNYEVKLLK